MPFHSFFAVITMNAHQIIGKDFYEALSIPWVPNLHDDQNLGGQITWATGEIPMALVLIALCVQWFISDCRDQRRSMLLRTPALMSPWPPTTTCSPEWLVRRSSRTIQGPSHEHGRNESP